MALYVRMHSKVSSWQFYLKGELIIHGQKNVASSEYTSITPENVQVISNTVKSDHQDDLADVMKDSATEFFVENNENKHEDQNEEDNLMDKL